MARRQPTARRSRRIPIRSTSTRTATSASCWGTSARTLTARRRPSVRRSRRIRDTPCHTTTSASSRSTRGRTSTARRQPTARRSRRRDPGHSWAHYDLGIVLGERANDAADQARACGGSFEAAAALYEEAAEHLTVAHRRRRPARRTREHLKVHVAKATAALRLLLRAHAAGLPARTRTRGSGSRRGVSPGQYM